MELIRGLSGLRPRHRPCVATIGAFDGVHRGHRAVIDQVRAAAREHSLPGTLVTFEPQPLEFLQPADAPARLSTLREKCELLAACGVDRLLCLRFDDSLRQMSATEFVEDILVAGLGIRALILGDDFRFGRGRQGDTELMRRLGEMHGYSTSPTMTVEHDGERISSTRLRAALEAGDFALAESLLGRPFTLGGRVQHGQALGRQIGTPTANIALHRLVSPLRGVFAVTAEGAGLDDAPAIANIGTRPTVEEGARATLEVHILDGSPELYGARLRVTPRRYLRAEQRFASVDALRAQIESDKEQARQYFAARDGDAQSA